jgi:hypothetical protein
VIIIDPCAAGILDALSKAERESKIVFRKDLVKICGRNLSAYQRAAQTLIDAGLVEDATHYAIPPSANLVFKHLALTHKGRDYCLEQCIGQS